MLSTHILRKLGGLTCTALAQRWLVAPAVESIADARAAEYQQAVLNLEALHRDAARQLASARPMQACTQAHHRA